jgi:hypothetical protein
MREYKTSLGGIIVNLDDPKTYEDLSKDKKILDEKMFSEIGFALCYMNIWHKDIFGKKKRDGGQKKRVMKMIESFCNERKNHYNDVLWLQEELYLFQDEIENMC